LKEFCSDGFIGATLRWWLPVLIATSQAVSCGREISLGRVKINHCYGRQRRRRSRRGVSGRGRCLPGIPKLWPQAVTPMSASSRF